MTNNEKAHYIIDLIKVITIEIEEYPMRRKQLLLLRSHLEKAVRLTGTGMYREFKRPESLPLVSHEKALPQIVDKPKNIEPSSSIADNIPEPTSFNLTKSQYITNERIISEILTYLDRNQVYTNFHSKDLNSLHDIPHPDFKGPF